MNLRATSFFSFFGSLSIKANGGGRRDAAAAEGSKRTRASLGREKNRSFFWKEEKEQGFLLAVKCISYEGTYLVRGVLG